MPIPIGVRLDAAENLETTILRRICSWTIHWQTHFGQATASERLLNRSEWVARTRLHRRLEHQLRPLSGPGASPNDWHLSLETLESRRRG